MSFLIQPHVRLQEWVAEEHGFFREAGLDYEFEPQGLAGSTVSTAPVRTTDEAPDRGRTAAPSRTCRRAARCDVSAACHWAVNAAASVQWRQDVGQGVLASARPGSSSPPESGLPAARGSGGRRRWASATTPAATTRPSRGWSRILERAADRAELHRAAVRPRAAGARPQGAGGERVRRPVLRARAARVPQARGHDLHDGLPAERGRRRGGRREVLHRRCGARSATSTSSPSGTSTTGCARCRDDLLSASWMCGGSAPASGSCSSRTRARCSSSTHRWMRTWDLFDPDAAARPEYGEAVLT